MGSLIIGFSVVVLGIFSTALSKQLTDEIKDWTPWVIKRLVNFAVRKLADEQQGRYEEEWLSHINEIPGEIGKLVAALGFYFAAQKMSSRIGVRKRALDVLLSLSFILFEFPLILMITTVIKARDGGPIFIREKRRWNNQTFSLLKFRTMSDDGQCTNLGQFLRRSRLDEIPILFNILRGDLSFYKED